MWAIRVIIGVYTVPPHLWSPGDHLLPMIIDDNPSPGRLRAAYLALITLDTLHHCAYYAYYRRRDARLLEKVGL